jgi:hypothetical protein
MNDDFCRQQGRTTALKEACEKINGQFVCANQEQAKIHNGKILSNKLVGLNKPIILDHYSQKLILSECLTRIISLERDIQSIKDLVCSV